MIEGTLSAETRLGRLCVFEDKNVANLEPLTLTRPAFDLRCGAFSLLERHCRAFNADEVGAWVRMPLKSLCQFNHPNLTVNDAEWLGRQPTLLVNARWMPILNSPLPSPRPGIFWIGHQVAFALLPPAFPARHPDTPWETYLENQKTLPSFKAPGSMINYPWDLFERNADCLAEDFHRFDMNKRGRLPATLSVVGSPTSAFIDAEAEVEPWVVADVRKGPVIVDRGAILQSFSRLEGPCYIGPETTVVAGANIRGSSLGQNCRAGGEIDTSIIQGFSNKYHEGFLGHSVVGEWVNLAAGVQVSDLRGDYRPITVTVRGQRVPTRQNKIGAFFGDHIKTGLGTLINQGSVFGAFCNLLPTGSLLPRNVPSFCNIHHGHIQERTDLDQALETAANVMRRRGREWTSVHSAFYTWLFEESASERDPFLWADKTFSI